jgi:hypothetical protein
MYMKLGTKLYLEVFSCILRCCALSEITVAQVFSLICTLDRNNHLVEVIKLVIADSMMSQFCSYLENWSNDDETLAEVIKLVIADSMMSHFCLYLENWANDDENKF